MLKPVNIDGLIILLWHDGESYDKDKLEKSTRIIIVANSVKQS